MKNLMVSLLLAFAFLCAGCMPEKATTQVGGGAFGWNFKDSKDNDVSIKNAKYNPSTSEASVEDLTIRNNASDVNRTLAEMMLANAEQWKAVAEHTRALTDGMAKISASLSWLTGFGGGGAPSDDEMLSRVKQLQTLTAELQNARKAAEALNEATGGDKEFDPSN